MITSPVISLNLGLIYKINETMTQIEKIKAEIDRLRHSGYAYNRGAYEAICTIEDFINSLQAEPVSEDLELVGESGIDLVEASIDYCGGTKGADARVRTGFISGANWQKERMMTALLDMEKDSVEVERKYGEGGRELYLKMLGVLRPFEED